MSVWWPRKQSWKVDNPDSWRHVINARLESMSGCSKVGRFLWTRYYSICWPEWVFINHLFFNWQCTSAVIFYVWLLMKWLVAWHSGRTSVSGRRTFPVLHSTCSWWVTTNVGKPSAIGQPTRPTQPFILSGSIKWVVSWNQIFAAVYR